MKIWKDGVVRELTEAELAEMQANMPDSAYIPEPTPEERIAELEKIIAEQDAALMELASMLVGGA